MALENEDPDGLYDRLFGDDDDTSGDTTDDTDTETDPTDPGTVDPPDTNTDNDPFIPSSLADLGFPDLGKYADTLVAIAKNPRSFVLGALLSALLAGILDLFNTVVDALRLVLIGSKIGYAEHHTYIGLEDLPLILWNVIGAPFGSIGGIIIGLVNSLQSIAESFAMELGLFAYPAAVAFIVLTIIVVERSVTSVSRATLASVPIVGSFLEVLLFE